MFNIIVTSTKKQREHWLEEVIEFTSSVFG